MTGYDEAGYDRTGYADAGYENAGYENAYDGISADAEPDLTGHPSVDAALRAVVAAGSVAPVDQVPAYQAAHRTLRDTLASIDEQ